MLKKVARKISAYYRPLFVENIVGKQDEYPYRALLYYKTGWFLKNNNNLEYKQNEWEIIEIVRILNSLGCVVDVVDRGLSDFSPIDKYQLFSIKDFIKKNNCPFGLVINQSETIIKLSPELLQVPVRFL